MCAWWCATPAKTVISADTDVLRSVWTNGPVNKLLGVVSKDNLSHSNSL